MTWTNEAELVASFVDRVGRLRDNPWTVYAETAGWDLLLQHRDGYQLGIEAKMSLNAKVIDQALTGATKWHVSSGPDYRGVLVPEAKLQNHLERICTAIGIGIISLRPEYWQTLNLPDERYTFSPWPNWCPGERCTLPDYVPDVGGGHAAPVQLTLWKIKAIKLLILLERRGYVTRADMKALQISPTRWTDTWYGFLTRDPSGQGFVSCTRTPDLKAQHPTNWAEIEADFPKWGQALLFAGSAAA
jgi:hypothetical protein